MYILIEQHQEAREQLYILIAPHQGAREQLYILIAHHQGAREQHHDSTASGRQREIVSNNNIFPAHSQNAYKNLELEWAALLKIIQNF